MVDERLVEYVKDLTKNGYSIQVITDQLSSHGYSADIINQVLRAAQGTHRYARVLLVILAGVGAVVGLGVVLIMFFSGEDSNIMLTTTPTQASIQTGGTLVFDVVLKNSIDKPTMVNIRHDILRDGQVEQQEQDALTVRKEHTQTVRIPLSPSISVGEYMVRTTIMFLDQEKTQQFALSIEQGSTNYQPVALSMPTASLDACSPECNDFNACTTDVCNSGQCTYTEKNTCCGNGRCEAGENVLSCSDDCQEHDERLSVSDIKNNAHSLAGENKQLAAQECARIALDYEHDNCFGELSDETKDPLFCTPIFNSERKDACYLQFALTDIAVCTNIIDTRLQQTCLQYAQFSQLSGSV